MLSYEQGTISRMKGGWVLFREQVYSASYLKNLEHFNVEYSVQYTSQYNVQKSVQYSVQYSMI